MAVFALNSSSKLSRKFASVAFAAVAATFAFSGAVTSAFAQDAAKNPVATLTLKDGEVKIELMPELAPQHVARITELANAGFYDGLKFHRVIPGFMAQTGDPLGNGTGKSELPNVPAEFNRENFERGTLGMARSSMPDSANSQFFIVTADSPHLNAQYTLFGKVTSGMEFVDMVKEGDINLNGTVDNPDSIITFRVDTPE